MHFDVQFWFLVLCNVASNVKWMMKISNEVVSCMVSELCWKSKTHYNSCYKTQSVNFQQFNGFWFATGYNNHDKICMVIFSMLMKIVNVFFIADVFLFKLQSYHSQSWLASKLTVKWKWILMNKIMRCSWNHLRMIMKQLMLNQQNQRCLKHLKPKHLKQI